MWSLVGRGTIVLPGALAWPHSARAHLRGIKVRTMVRWSRSQGTRRHKTLLVITAQCRVGRETLTTEKYSGSPLREDRAWHKSHSAPGRSGVIKNPTRSVWSYTTKWRITIKQHTRTLSLLTWVKAEARPQRDSGWFCTDFSSIRFQNSYLLHLAKHIFIVWWEYRVTTASSSFLLFSSLQVAAAFCISSLFLTCCGWPSSSSWRRPTLLYLTVQ